MKIPKETILGTKGLEYLARAAGFSPEQKSEGRCINCKQEALPKCYSDAGKREFAISGLCEVCFDNMFKDEK